MSSLCLMNNFACFFVVFWFFFKINFYGKFFHWLFVIAVFRMLIKLSIVCTDLEKRKWELQYFNCLPASSDFCRLLITFANSLDQDRDQSHSWSGSIPFDCLIVFLIFFLKNLILKSQKTTVLLKGLFAKVYIEKSLQRTTKAWKITQHAKS